jgi:signal transduction histidine kinase
MQAEIALHLRHSRPAQAHDALTAISAASAEALNELRATLETISPVQVGAPSDRGPTPGLARVPQLCDRLHSSGLTVNLTITGTADPLPAAADVTAYRVVQEALTNVVKHSPHPGADVLINHEPDAVRILITNQAMDTGHVDGLGITGMRRRVESLGGTLTAGLDTVGPGTFTVSASIPRPPKETK